MILLSKFLFFVFLNDEIPGANWSLMKHVLHDQEGNVKIYTEHMQIMPWLLSSGEVYKDSE